MILFMSRLSRFASLFYFYFYVSLKMEGEDYLLLNNRAYELLQGWYGGGPHFKRWVVSLGSETHSQLTVELFPVK